MSSTHSGAACFIRQAVPDDAALLPVIETSAAKSFLALPELSFIAAMPVMAEEMHLEFMQKGCVLVAENDGRLAGFLVAEPFTAENTLHVWELSVHQDFQRRGIGRQLLEAGAEQAQKSGLQHLTLTTFNHVPWNRVFYERCGFSVLVHEQQNERLLAIRAHEQSLGLPVEHRVAMRQTLSAKSEIRTLKV